MVGIYLASLSVCTSEWQTNVRNSVVKIEHKTMSDCDHLVRSGLGTAATSGCPTGTGTLVAATRRGKAGTRDGDEGVAGGRGLRRSSIPVGAYSTRCRLLQICYCLHSRRSTILYPIYARRTESRGIGQGQQMSLGFCASPAIYVGPQRKLGMLLPEITTVC